jgi:predicted DNA-binding transcriptional regulator YafY
MARSENGKQKLIRLIEILIKYTDDEHGLTISEIIDKLSEYGIKAERKSIYDDFFVLEEMGIPVLKNKAKQTRYSIDFAIFELAELKMLVDAVQSSKFITAKKSRELISRLERFTSIYKSKELSRQVYVEDRIKTVNPASIYTVDSVHNAINSDKELNFRYFEYNSDKTKHFRHDGKIYSVTPISLVWSEENYYLVAYEQATDNIKHFRIDKMADVSIFEKKRAHSHLIDKFNPSDYSRKVFGMYGGREELVVFECRDSLAGVMIDRFGFDPVFHKTDFGFKFSLRVMVSPTFFAWALGFGDQIKILGPSSVVDELKEMIDKTRSLYGGLNEKI